MKFQLRKIRGNTASVDVLSALSVAGLILLSGLLISLYTLLVRQLALRTSSEDAVKQATMFVANDLRKTAVSDQSFGLVGLCDTDLVEGQDRKPITSLNRIYATLRLDNLIGKDLELPVVERLVATDFERMQKLEKELRVKINNRINATDKTSKVYEEAYKIAASARHSDEELMDLRIRLGTIKSAELNSGMPVSGADPEEARISSKGTYLANVEIPITATGCTKFTQLAEETKLVDNPQFVECEKDETPSVVLLEATFRSSRRNQKIDLVRTRTAAAVLGGVNTKAPDSVLMISFPQGMPGTLHSLRALTMGKGDQQSGTWQQASGGTVPGDGHLIAAFGVDSTEMDAGGAIQTSFYHWLRSLGPTAKSSSAEKLFEFSWASLPVRTDENQRTTRMAAAQTGPNSALTKDTGARTFAIFYQTGPGGFGQSVLKTAFQAESTSPSLPRSALPLTIDEHGNCNLAGRTGFDRKLVSDLLEATYETNLVANESINVAKSVISRLDRAVEQSTSSINVTNEELTSLIKRHARLEQLPERTTELALLQKSENDLRNTLQSQRDKRYEYQQVKERANTVLMNAESAAQAAFDVCANMSKYAQDGIFRCDDHKSFLLSGEYVFHPLNRSVTEEEIYKIDGKSPWLSEYNIIEPAPDELIAEGKTVKALRAALRTSNTVPAARFVIFESRQLLSNDPKVLVLSHSPFNDTGIPEGQLSYYSQDALMTGSDPSVGWSLLVRDVVANQAAGGVPIPSAQNKWCLGEERAVSSCPGLGVEIQVRSPVPLIPDLPVGSFVVNPLSHERVSQIPPMPANML